jgi:cytochrome c5
MALGVTLFACSSSPDEAGQDSCTATDGRAVVEQTCQGCHASTLRGAARNGATVGVNFDTDADVRLHEARIRIRALVQKDMPPTNDLLDCEKEALQAYLDDLTTATCTPDCSGKACGPDGCNGTCGSCDALLVCNTTNGQCVSTCTPSCAGKTCGDDGCGGSCGSCSSSLQSCDSGQCIWTPKTYENDVAPIFQAAGCGTSSCHGGTTPSSGLDLSSAVTGYGSLFDVASVQCLSTVRVVPEDIASSYLVNKLTGIGMCAGSRMPQGGNPLTVTQIDTVRAWIATGAAF